MARIDNVKVIMEIEPIVKLRCLDYTCRFNLRAISRCNFKKLLIDEHGKCKFKESIKA